MGGEKTSAASLGLCVFQYHERTLSRPLLKGAFPVRDLSTKFTLYLSWLLEPEGITSSDWHLREPMVSTDLPSRDLCVCTSCDFFLIFVYRDL